jgi:hypothetical protein
MPVTLYAPTHCHAPDTAYSAEAAYVREPEQTRRVKYLCLTACFFGCLGLVGFWMFLSHNSPNQTASERMEPVQLPGKDDSKGAISQQRQQAMQEIAAQRAALKREIQETAAHRAALKKESEEVAAARAAFKTESHEIAAQLADLKKESQATTVQRAALKQGSKEIAAQRAAFKKDAEGIAAQLAALKKESHEAVAERAALKEAADEVAAQSAALKKEKLTLVVPRAPEVRPGGVQAPRDRSAKSQSRSPSGDSPLAAVLLAEDLVRSYWSNTDAEFKGRKIQVTGEVKHVDEDEVLYLGGPGNGLAGKRWVACRFSSAFSRKHKADLYGTDTVTVEGTYRSGAASVELRDCVRIK